MSMWQNKLVNFESIIEVYPPLEGVSSLWLDGGGIDIKKLKK